MNLSQNTPGKSLTPSFPLAGEHLYQITFSVVSASVAGAFGHSDHELKVGHMPEQETTRHMNLVLAYNKKALLGGVSVGSARLGDLFGACRIDERRDSDAKFSVGSLHYNPPHDPGDPLIGSPIPESYFLEIFLPPPLFDDIVENLRTAKLPEINISVRGLSLPTEFSYAWDVEKAPSLPIINFDACFVTAVNHELRNEHNPFETPEEKLYFPLNKGDLAAIAQQLTRQGEWIKDLDNRLRWIVYGVGALTAFALWKLLGL
jgi:hypothetical protein